MPVNLKNLEPLQFLSEQCNFISGVCSRQVPAPIDVRTSFIDAGVDGGTLSRNSANEMSVLEVTNVLLSFVIFTLHRIGRVKGMARSPENAWWHAAYFL